MQAAINANIRIVLIPPLENKIDNAIKFARIWSEEKSDTNKSKRSLDQIRLTRKFLLKIVP